MTAARILCTAVLLLALGILPAHAEDFPKPDDSGRVEVALKSRNQTLVVFLSGDGGWWGDLDAQLARDLAGQGYAVVGLDTGVWWSDPRTPEAASRRIADLIHAYQRKARARQVLLVGYSFGADWVPLIYNRLPPKDRELVSGLILIAVGRMASLEVTLAERAGLTQGDLDLEPELAKLPAPRTRCIYGFEEAGETGCTLDAIPPQYRNGLPGGHHFQNDMATLSRVVLGMARDLTPSAPSSLRW